MKKNVQRLLSLLTALMMAAGMLPMHALADTTVYSDDVVIGEPVSRAPATHNLRDYLTNVVIDAPTNEAGEYMVAAGDPYSVILSFRENRDRQFPADSRQMTYRLPAGMQGVVHDETPITITINHPFFGRIEVPNNMFSVQGGEIRFHFTDDATGRAWLNSVNNLGFNIEFEGIFTGTETHLEFSDTIHRDIVIDDSNSVSASKVGSVDKKNGVIKYTVNIRSDGKSRHVTATDTVTGTGLTLDPASFQFTSSTGRPVPANVNTNGNSFTWSIPEMQDGEIITMTYEVEIDPSQIQQNSNGRYVTTADNGVLVTSDDDNDNTPVTTEHVIDYTPGTWKSQGTVVAVDEENQTNTLSWQLVVNDNPMVSMAGSQISDRIGSGSDIMKYSGDGISIAVFDASGTQVETRQVSWSSLGIDPATATAWTYTVPADDAGHAYKYVISYTTEADVSGLTGTTAVSNIGEGPGGSSEGTGYVNPTEPGPEEFDAELTKTHTPVDIANKEVTWVVSFIVPPEGFDKAVVTDTYPNAWIPSLSANVYERVKEGSITVSGLDGNESYDVAYNDTNAVITFYKDQSRQHEGLNESLGTREITVTLKTEISDEWVAEAGVAGTTYLSDHTNQASLDYGIGTDQDSDTIRVRPRGIEKTVTEVGPRTDESGAVLPVFMYEIDLSGVNEDSFTLTDTFDTSILKAYVPASFDWGKDPFYIYGGTQYYTTERKGDHEVAHLETSTGLEFVVDSSSLPMNGEEYYSNYHLTYYLTVRDAAALKRLNTLAANSENGVYTVVNTAEWDTRTATEDFDWSYEGLDKEMTSPESALEAIDQDIVLDFRITLNPGGLIINGGDPVEMVDSFENISIIYDSITATPPDGVTWDFSGNVATFTIPDATKVVITYSARVTFETIGEIGDTVIVSFENTATMMGFSDHYENDASRTNRGGGEGSGATINLMKYEAGDMNKRLQGAVFQLFNGTKNGSTFVKGDPVIAQWVDETTGEVTYGDPVILTTDANGMINVYGDEERDGWSLYAGDWYCLTEITAPSGYMLAGFDYTFMISEDGTTDYSNYIYHSGDTLSAKNYPGTDVKVEKVWTDGNENHESDNVTVKLQQKIDGGEWSDTIRKEVEVDGRLVWQDDEGPTTLTLSAENDWAGIFKSLPLVVPSTLTEGEVPEDVNVEYQIVETAVNGAEPEEGKVTIEPKENDGDFSFTVTNEVPATGSLNITKNVTVNEAAAEGTQADGTYYFTITDASGAPVVTAQADADGYYTITVVNGESGTLEVTDLPVGTYTVSEDTDKNPAGMSLFSDNDVEVTVEGGVTGEAAETAEFTNNINFFDLSVTKTVSAAGAGVEEKEFPFSITLTFPEGQEADSADWTKVDAEGNITNGTLTLSEGVGSFTLKAGETITFTGLPEGTVYTVDEPEADMLPGYDRLDPEEPAEGTVDSDQEVLFTNQYSAEGEFVLEGEKTLNGGDVSMTAEDAQNFTFTAYYEDTAAARGTTAADGSVSFDTIAVEYDPMTTTAPDDRITVADGVATVHLVHGDLKTEDIDGFELTLTVAEDLPDGVTAENPVKDGIRYSTETHEVIVTFTDDGEGTIVPSFTVDGTAVDENVTLDSLLTFDNTKQGSLKLKKTVTVNGAAVTEDTRAMTNGDYTFTVTPQAAEGAAEAEPVATIVITISDGEMTAATVNGEAAALTEDGYVQLDDLMPGAYVIAETENTNVNGITMLDEPLEVTVTAGGDAAEAEAINNLELTEATIKKVWDDANNQDGKRPETLTVTLSNGEEVTLSDENEWTATVENLPKYADGEEIVYTWTEGDMPEGYELTDSSVNGTVTTLTNSYDTENTQATVRKVWDDAENQDGKRPETLTVTLSNGTEVTLSEENGWSATVSELPKYADGEEIVYTWTEGDLPEGYELTDSSVNGTVTTLTNSYDTENTQATVRKVWDDAENQDGKRPETLTVTLSNGTEVTLSEENGWSATVSELPKYADGEEIVYTWTEGDMPEGYELTDSSVNGTITTLTNSYTPEETEATVKKVWDDAENQDGKRPETLTVTLSDGTEVTLSEENEWTATVTGLAKYADGEEIEYTWTEGDLPEGYTLSDTSVNGTITTLTNSYAPEETEATVKKVWDDAENQDGKRPETLTVTLSDGTEVTLSEENEWTATVTGLPKYAGGEEIVYTWTEGDMPEGYELTDSSVNGTVTTLSVSS